MKLSNFPRLVLKYITESDLKLRSGALQSPFYKPLNLCWFWDFTGPKDREDLIDRKVLLVGKGIIV